jgi:hypothetical protein
LEEDFRNRKTMEEEEQVTINEDWRYRELLEEEKKRIRKLWKQKGGTGNFERKIEENRE